MPIINKDPIPKTEFWSKLEQYLNQWDSVHVIADWPEDIAHLCQALIFGPGYAIPTPNKMTFEVNRDIDAKSDLPHNALADAIAIRDMHLQMEAELFEKMGWVLMSNITTDQEAFHKVRIVAKEYGITNSDLQFECYEIICDELKMTGSVDRETYTGIFECMNIKQSINAHLDIIEDHEKTIDILIERCNHRVVNSSPTGVQYCRGCGQFL